jgi:uncharacterized membrane protein
MPPRIANTSRHSLRSLTLLLAEVCVWSLQLWTLLAERQLNTQLWPSDIHAAVVSALGGFQTLSVIGGRRFELPWLHVFVASLAAVAVVLVAAALSAYRRPRDRSSTYPLPQLLHAAAAAMLPAAAFAALWIALWSVAPLLPGTSILSLLISAAPPTLGLTLALPATALSSLFANPARIQTQIPDQPSPSGQQPRRFKLFTPLLAVLLAAALWQCTSFWMNSRLYHNLLVPHGDSAMYEEHLWNTWHGKGFRSYLDQGLFLGEHIQVIHLLMLPLYVLWPHYLLLEWTSTACLAACSIPVYSLALRHSGCRTAAAWLALAWLLYNPMHFLDIAIDLKTLRPSCYGLLVLFLAIDFAEQKRHLIASLCFLLALLTQEDFALITGPIGIALALVQLQHPRAQRDRSQLQWALSLAVVSVAWVLLAVLVVIPAFRAGEVVHYSRYFGDLGRSPSELIHTALTDPARVASVVFSKRTLLYIVLLAGPIAFLPFRSPLRLAAGLLTFLMLSLIQLGSDTPGQSGVDLPPIPFHHFHAPLLPVLFWAAAAGLRIPRVNTLTHPLFHTPAAAARFAFCCAAGTAITTSLMPCGTAFWSAESSYGWKQLYAIGTRGTELEKILRQIPPSARVASTDFVHTRLTHFDRSYDYSGYVRAVNQNRIGAPPDTDFIIIDTTHRYSTIHSPDQIPELNPQPPPPNSPRRQTPDSQTSAWELIPNQSRGAFLVLRRRNSRFPAPDLMGP